MPYDPSGNFSLVPSYLATPGQTIRTEQHNPPLEDIAQALSSVLLRDGRSGMIGNLSMSNHKITGLASGTNPDDAATVGQLQDTFLIGEIKIWPLPTLPPKYLWCDGSALPANTPYTQLRQLLVNAGSPFGTSSGNPRLPDLRGRVVVGKDNMGGAGAANRITDAGSGINGTQLGAAGGTQTHTLTAQQIPSHNHGGVPTQVTVARDGWGTTGGNLGSVTRGRMVVGSGNSEVSETLESLRAAGNNQTFSLSGSKNTNSVGDGQAHPNVQPSLILNFIIRASS